MSWPLTLLIIWTGGWVLGTLACVALRLTLARLLHEPAELWRYPASLTAVGLLTGFLIWPLKLTYAIMYLGALWWHRGRL